MYCDKIRPIALSPDLALTFKSEGSPDSVNLIYVDMTLACRFCSRHRLEVQNESWQCIYEN